MTRVRKKKPPSPGGKHTFSNSASGSASNKGLVELLRTTDVAVHRATLTLSSCREESAKSADLVPFSSLTVSQAAACVNRSKDAQLQALRERLFPAGKVAEERALSMSTWDRPWFLMLRQQWRWLVRSLHDIERSNGNDGPPTVKPAISFTPDLSWLPSFLHLRPHFIVRLTWDAIRGRGGYGSSVFTICNVYVAHVLAHSVFPYCFFTHVAEEEDTFFWENDDDARVWETDEEQSSCTNTTDPYLDSSNSIFPSPSLTTTSRMAMNATRASSENGICPGLRSPGEAFYPVCLPGTEEVDEFLGTGFSYEELVPQVVCVFYLFWWMMLVYVFSYEFLLAVDALADSEKTVEEARQRASMSRRLLEKIVSRFGLVTTAFPMLEKPHQMKHDSFPPTRTKNRRAVDSFKLLPTYHVGRIYQFLTLADWCCGMQLDKDFHAILSAQAMREEYFFRMNWTALHALVLAERTWINKIRAVGKLFKLLFRREFFEKNSAPTALDVQNGRLRFRWELLQRPEWREPLLRIISLRKGPLARSRRTSPANSGEAADFNKWGGNALLAQVMAQGLRFGRQDIVEAAARNGADPAKKFWIVAPFGPISREALLNIAAIAGHPEMVRWLLDREVDVNAIGGNGRQTALHAAAFSGQHEVISVLLERGANIFAADASGHTALGIVDSAMMVRAHWLSRNPDRWERAREILRAARQARRAGENQARLNEEAGERGRRRNAAAPGVVNGEEAARNNDRQLNGGPAGDLALNHEAEGAAERAAAEGSDLNDQTIEGGASRREIQQAQKGKDKTVPEQDGSTNSLQPSTSTTSSSSSGVPSVGKDSTDSGHLSVAGSGSSSTSSSTSNVSTTDRDPQVKNLSAPKTTALVEEGSSPSTLPGASSSATVGGKSAAGFQVSTDRLPAHIINFNAFAGGLRGGDSALVVAGHTSDSDVSGDDGDHRGRRGGPFGVVRRRGFDNNDGADGNGRGDDDFSDEEEGSDGEWDDEWGDWEDEDEGDEDPENDDEEPVRPGDNAEDNPNPDDDPENGQGPGLENGGRVANVLNWIDDVQRRYEAWMTGGPI
ncbi:unnamed protein product [Amoebophrya sp. A25]|nr:unnamed protein product [Amoebophrya sp. A25]|eukprot:GSA25T00016066001.1